MTTSPKWALKDYLPVPVVTDAQMVFGDISHLPPAHLLPEEYLRATGTDRDPVGCRFASDLFFRGSAAAKEYDFTAKEGVDVVAAGRAISAILRSFAPKHEHKIAGAGWLCDQWFNITPKTP